MAWKFIEKIRDYFSQPCQITIAILRSNLYYLLFVVATVSLPIIFLGVFTLTKFQNVLEQNAVKRNTIAVMSFSRIVENRVQGVKKSLENLSESGGLKQALKGKDEAKIRSDLTGLVENNEHLERAFIVNNKGVQLYAYPHDPRVIGMDFSFRDWYVKGQSLNKTYVSGVYNRAAFKQEKAMAVTVPIRSGQEGFSGYLVGQVLVDQFQKMLMDSSDGYGGDLFLLDQSGAVIAGEAITALPDIFEDFYMIPQSKTGVIKELRVSNEKTDSICLVSFREIPGLGWKVVAAQPLSEILEPSREVRNWVIPIMLFIILSTLLTGYFWGYLIKRYEAEKQKRIAKRIHNVRRSAHVQAELEQQALFAYISTHDLQEPLYKILLFSRNILESGSISDEKNKEMIQKIESVGSQMLQLIQRIHDFARSATLENNITRVDLNEIIEEIRQTYAETLRSEKILVEIGKLPQIFTDRRKLSKALQCVFENAVKFRKPEGKARIEIKGSRETDDRCIIKIRDNGIGLDMKYVEDIFRPLHRMRSGIQPGLGLATARKLLSSLNGDIYVNSKEGEGAEVTIEIPSLSEDQNTVFEEDNGGHDLNGF